MKPSENLSVFKNLKNDLPAGLVVFLVAVPLCLGISLASGAPLFSGIIAGMVGGIVVTLFSGSPLGVSGPAAGLIAIVITSIADLGTFEAFLLAVLISGIFQVLLGFAKAGIIAYYFPSSVIKGMLSGIGIIIILKQIPHAVGYDKDFEGDLGFKQMDGHNTLSELYYMLDFLSMGAIIISVLSLGILVLWEQPFIKKFKITQIIQGPLVAVLAGIGLNLVFLNIPSLALKSEQMVNLPVPENIMGFFGQFTFPDFSQITNPQVYLVAVTIAVVASLESLLCVEATDKLDPYKRVTPTNRELKAQGVGNIVSGLIGGLPITQVIVRSSANIQSGGKTKVSALFHGMLLLLCAMAIPNILNLIPLASLAAILLVVGYKLAKPAVMKEMLKLGSKQYIPFFVTIVAIVFTDLLIGIGLGLVVAVFFILYNNYKNPYLFHPEDHHEGETIKIVLSEEVTFLNKANILQSLNHLPDNTKVILDASRTVHIDYDVMEILNNFKENAKTRNIEIVFKNFEFEKDNKLGSVARLKKAFQGDGKNKKDEDLQPA
ncbi:SulP family inorganic anion transporter [Flexithrix dorotheae]|uniref:SulP family inorganic anion transporter n=1 Tax=Flexithrix dorotheae TaxID=70993 RepID=UPI00036D0455|nr:SulP family inorganic anion transporter [Flexithrix dorotheae]